MIHVGEAQRHIGGLIRQSVAADRRLFQVTAQVVHGLSPVGRLLRLIDMPVLPAGIEDQVSPVTFTDDVRTLHIQRWRMAFS